MKSPVLFRQLDDSSLSAFRITAGVRSFTDRNDPYGSRSRERGTRSDIARDIIGAMIEAVVRHVQGSTSLVDSLDRHAFSRAPKYNNRAGIIFIT